MTSFIPAVLVKLTLILMLGLVVAASLRAAAASLRHLILFATICSGLALPVVMLLTPRWDATVLPAPSALTAAHGSGSAPGSAAKSGGSDVSLGDPRTSSQQTSTSTASPALTATVIDATPSGPELRSDSIGAVLPILWAVGLIAILSWLTIGRIRLHRIARTSWALNGSDWTRLLDEERREAGLDKAVRLFSSSVVSTPSPGELALR